VFRNSAFPLFRVLFFEKLKQINEAWAVLSDPAKRRNYDLKLQCAAPADARAFFVFRVSYELP